ncbi:signal peptidase II [Phaeobacter gallaeciensis]|uniref:Lipoprotein signal peptidase n=2 Tax=Roseobacteraceae TaxID=2854170 RepID=A0A366XA94_9RHOB|nr:MULTISPECIES: signal peptidase II [Roseobacteraceae]MBT3141844.1 signal peptidase II [Falsiruegeria litorea]RBW59943.1 signal peptidase II [Phaeobacter gallaeciensis]
MRLSLLFWATFWAFLCDQVSKYLVVHWMGVAQRGSIDVLPPLLTFRYGENRGINFGLLQGDTDIARWILIGLSVLICVIVIGWLYRTRASRWMLISGGFLIGGALGNVVDRLLYGYVLDFLNMSCCGFDNPYVFNVADIFIFAGAAGLILLDTKKPT